MPSTTTHLWLPRSGPGNVCCTWVQASVSRFQLHMSVKPMKQPRKPSEPHELRQRPPKTYICRERKRQRKLKHWLQATRAGQAATAYIQAQEHRIVDCGSRAGQTMFL